MSTQDRFLSTYETATINLNVNLKNVVNYLRFQLKCINCTTAQLSSLKICILQYIVTYKNVQDAEVETGENLNRNHSLSRGPGDTWQ